MPASRALADRGGGSFFFFFFFFFWGGGGGGGGGFLGGGGGGGGGGDVTLLENVPRCARSARMQAAGGDAATQPPPSPPPPPPPPPHPLYTGTTTLRRLKRSAVAAREREPGVRGLRTLSRGFAESTIRVVVRCDATRSDPGTPARRNSRPGVRRNRTSSWCLRATDGNKCATTTTAMSGARQMVRTPPPPPLPRRSSRAVKAHKFFVRQRRVLGSTSDGAAGSVPCRPAYGL